MTSRGRKSQETDPLGYSKHFGYDAVDRLASISNALGHVTRFYYNWRGDTTNVVYADDTESITWYDSYGSVTQMQGRAGGKTIRRYDDLGFVSEVVNPVGATNAYVYDDMGRVQYTVSPLGLIVSNTYDEIGRKIKETFSIDGTSNEWKYDPDGVRTQINRLNGETLFNYDGDGRLIAQRDSNENWTKFGYDSMGNRTHVTNELGGVYTNTYDNAGRIITMADCDGSIISNVYDGLGRLISRTDANGIVSSNVYDSAGRFLASWRGGYLLSSNSYNAIGAVVSRLDANGLMTSNTYDDVGRPLRTYMPDGTYFENVYSNTFLVQSTDRAGRKTFYERDVLGRVTNQIDNATNFVSYNFDASGNLTDLYDQNSSHTRFIFDEEGRQTGKVYADGVTNSYSYDALGRLTSKKDGKGLTTAYRYDHVGNLTNIDYVIDTDVYFEYDEINRMIEMVDGVGTSTYAYVSSCAVASSIDGPFENDTISYGYDLGERLTSVTSSSSVVEYSYDTMGRITQVIESFGTNAASTNAYVYIANGRLKDSLAHANGVETDYEYDSLFRLTNLTHQSGGSKLASYAYTYNNADLRTSVTLGGPGAPRTINYGYDPVGQLVDAQGDFPGHNFDYVYDSAGNPIVQNNNGFVMSNAFNNLNQNTEGRWSGSMGVIGTVNITNGSVSVNGVPASIWEALDGTGLYVATNLPVSAGSNIYTAIHADPLGRAATSTVSVVANNQDYGYDANGNLTNDGQFAYVWDEADRLVQVDKGSDVIMTCTYDGLSRRRERILSSSESSSASTNRYVYHNWQVLEVRDDDIKGQAYY